MNMVQPQHTQESRPLQWAVPRVVILSVLFCALIIATGRTGWAKQDGAIPRLPATDFDYVSYAVDNLPEHYRPSPPFGDAGASDNTPEDNPTSNAGATLGRVLFFDKRLSINQSISCASCHTQETGFGDVRQFSVGHDGLALTQRHSMALSNAVFYESGRFRWDESAATLEEQVLIPIEAEDEMGLPLSVLRQRIVDTPFYEELFVKAFGDAIVTDDRIARAMSQFVRSMVSYQSKYDQAFANGSFGFPDFESVFTESEMLGQRLFERTPESVNCHECHTSVAFIGNEARNIGLDLMTIDPGAGDARFKVPSLRNVAVRGRFMHDGRFETLTEVVEFYNSGVQDHPNLDPFLRVGGDPKAKVERLNLTPEEVQGIVDFMVTFTDYAFLTDPKFSDPFEVSLPGDVNRDGVVDSDDVSLFIELLVAATYQAEADIDLNGVVNLLDVQPFVQLLKGN